MSNPIAISLHERAPDGSLVEVSFRGYERASIPPGSLARADDTHDLLAAEALFLTLAAGDTKVTHIGAHFPSGETVIYVLAEPCAVGAHPRAKVRAGVYRRAAAHPAYSCGACGGRVERTADFFTRACGHDGAGVVASMSAVARGISRTGATLGAAGGIGA